VSRNSLGREFHSLRPSTENTRRPHEFRRYNGTTSWWPAAEHRWRLCANAISETGTQSAPRYRGAELYRLGSDESSWWLYTRRAAKADMDIGQRNPTRLIHFRPNQTNLTLLADHIQPNSCSYDYIDVDHLFVCMRSSLSRKIQLSATVMPKSVI